MMTLGRDSDWAFEDSLGVTSKPGESAGDSGPMRSCVVKICAGVTRELK